MKILTEILLNIFCILGLIGSLFYLPKTSTFLAKKFPKAKDISMQAIVIAFVLYGTASMATNFIGLK